jgi:phage head maturation protease
LFTTEVKIVSESGNTLRIAGYGVVFGGRDVVGDYFTKSTDFWFDRLTETPPVLFQHGQDDMLKGTVVGRVIAKHADDIGLWVEAQITASKKYADAIRELVAKGILGWSSGSVPHLVKRAGRTQKGTTEILSWPVVEFSLTPTPAEPRTVGIKELKSLAASDASLLPVLDTVKQMEGSYEDIREDICEAAGDLFGGMCQVVATFPDYAIVTTNGEDYFRIPYTLDSDGDPVLGTPEPVEMSFKPMSAPQKAQQGMARSDYAWVDSSGTGHLDISDEGHVRAAMARFNQTHFTEDGAKRSAARKILARARSMGIEVSPDSAVASAAKGVNMADLPDDAFGYVAPGGTLDDERKTFPRALRHFHHHDENGDVDRALLHQAVDEAMKADIGDHALSHLLAHLYEKADPHSKYWAEDSLAGETLVAAYKFFSALDDIVADQKSMERIGWQGVTRRVQPERLQALKELRNYIGITIERAEQAEAGDDGTQRAQALRYELELLEV